MKILYSLGFFVPFQNKTFSFEQYQIEIAIKQLSFPSKTPIRIAKRKAHHQGTPNTEDAPPSNFLRLGAQSKILNVEQGHKLFLRMENKLDTKMNEDV